MIALAALVALSGGLFSAPTVPTDVEQPGTQPLEVGPFVPPSLCKDCHGNGDDPDVEPYFGWQGGMMAHAARDPLFWAALAIVEQDFLPDADPNQRGGAGDLCLRCHLPGGWIAGRSTPTDGSGMLNFVDDDGVECEHCHLMVDPDPAVNVPGTIEAQTAPYVANDGSDGFYGSGMYVINAEGSRLGPYADIDPPHPFLQSSFHRESELCGSCHDVSNPIVGDLAHNFGAQQPLDPGQYSGIPGAPASDKAAFKNPPYRYGVVERTFSEWYASALSTLRVNDFDTLPADLRTSGGSIEVARSRAWDGASADYTDGTPRFFTCQTCHMSASTGKGCAIPGIPTRTDLPRHDLTGGGYWVPEVIRYQDDKGTLRFGSPVTRVMRDAMDASMLRARAMLQSAGDLQATLVGDLLQVQIVNLSGHKLITGYPEGRRMWLNLKWLDESDALIQEDGAYGPIGRDVEDLDGKSHAVESLLEPESAFVIATHPGIDQQWATQLLALGLDAGTPLVYDRMTDQVTETMGSLAAEPPETAVTTFHFVLNNVTLDDNRIPPYGFGYDEAKKRNALPVPATLYGDPGPGGTYDYRLTTEFSVPEGAVRVEVRLYYQQTSWEYVQFLWKQNDGQNDFLGQEGMNLLDAWANTGMSPPLEMQLDVVQLSGSPSAPGEASRQSDHADQLRAQFNRANRTISIGYAPACNATGHTIYYGPLSQVATYGYSGARCNVGATGSTSFHPGPGSSFFLVVGSRGRIEGSYGRSGDGTQRPEDVGTPGCDLVQDLGGTCDAR